jgi:hypothetical protein
MENKTIKLELTVNEVNTVLEALSNLAFKQVADIISKITQQGNNQLQKKEEVENAN